MRHEENESFTAEGTYSAVLIIRGHSTHAFSQSLILNECCDRLNVNSRAYVAGIDYIESPPRLL
jgi:hypothetical protein